MLFIKLSKASLLFLYSSLRSHFGFLDWWPAETVDEMLVGAILTQNTSWKNVEKAISNMRKEHLLSLKALSNASMGSITKAVKPSGFYRQKASRLKRFSQYITGNYSSIGMFFKRSKDPRAELLGIGGIGNETADSILLYAGNMPVFVVDAYTRRALSRIFGINAEAEPYEQLQQSLQRLLPRDIELYKDFHAQFVELGKAFCRKKPLCSTCPVRGMCLYAAKHKLKQGR